MGRNKDIRKQIKSFQRRISEHQTKIQRELQAGIPNVGYINHWRSEIEAWEDRIGKLKHRLGRDG